MVFAARLTQRGHKIQSMKDLMELYQKSYTGETIRAISSLPHPTVQKFAVITVAVVGASRRFLAQITRHQNETKFMSASLQYSDYAGHADFVVPYEVLTANPSIRDFYLKSCREAMNAYEKLEAMGISAVLWNVSGGVSCIIGYPSGSCDQAGAAHAIYPGG